MSLSFYFIVQTCQFTAVEEGGHSYNFKDQAYMHICVQPRQRVHASTPARTKHMRMGADARMCDKHFCTHGEVGRARLQQRKHKLVAYHLPSTWVAQSP